MTPEIESAAKEIANHFEFRIDGWDTPDDHVRAVITKILTRRFAPDNTPIDEAWLRSVGFEANGDLEFKDTGGKEWLLSYFGDGYFGIGALDVRATTRHDLRQLAAALGIPLRERTVEGE